MDNENDDTSPQTIIPLIIPSFDDSSSNQISTTNEGKQELLETQIPSNNNEYINPRGIRFATASPTNESVKGKDKSFVLSNKIFLLFRFINSIWLALCSWSLSFSHNTY